MKDIQHSNLNEQRPAFTLEGRSPYLLWLVWLVWLPLIIPSIVKLFQSQTSPPRLILTLLAVALFYTLYLWSSWRRARQLLRSPSPASFGPVDLTTWLVIAAMAALSVVLTLLGGSEWQALFFYTSGFVGGSMSIRRGIPVAFVLMLIALVVAWLDHLPITDLWQAIIFIPAIIFITKIVMWSITTSWELRAAREEIARLAVMTERLRIARDLHDLLGHNLSLITLKSELAGRLLTRAPERAATEISDIEQVARTTLQEVREAVASYRLPSLASELQAAHEILTAAGISYLFEGDESSVGSFPTTVETVLAWTVREGVTNVIRHSRAHQCTVRIEREKRRVLIEIKNDGLVAHPLALSQSKEMTTVKATGNGLRGLAERATALGGEFSAAPDGNGDFCLTISLPLTQKASPSTLASPRSASTSNDLAPIEERSMQS